jgi:cell division protein FtsZ
MTLDEISTVGERVTEAMDHDAEVIWGAQVTEEMNGEITVMTIMTGVNSPYLLGKNQEQESEEARQELSNELGIQMVK